MSDDRLAALLHDAEGPFGRAIHEDAYAMQVPSWGADECGPCLSAADWLRARGVTLSSPDLDVECSECGEGIRHRWPCSHVERCDEPGCDREADCGWPTKAGAPTFSGDPAFDGYRRTCGTHYRAALAESQP